MLALDRLYTQTGAWPELTEILRREIQLAENDAEIAELQYRLGHTLETSSVIARARSRSYREILDRAPDARGALGALENMFHAGHLQTEIAAVLEPLYEAASEFGKLHGILEVQLDQARRPGSPGDVPAPRPSSPSSKLYDQNKALDWWCAAIVEDPRWDRALEESERLAGETGAWNDMVAAYTRALERTQDKESAGMTLLRLARVYEFELHDAGERGRDAPARARDRGQGCRRARRARSPVPRTPAMYDDLAEILRRRIEVVSGPGRAARAVLPPRRDLHRRARRPRRRRSSATRRSSSRRAATARALEAIESIHFRREDWKKLLETYEKLIDTADTDAEMADIYARMARICSRRAQRGGAGRSSCSAACSTFVARSRRPSRPSRTSRRASEKWEELVEIVERQIAVAPGDARADRALQAPRSRVGREARPRAQRARCVARRRSHRRQRPRDAALAGAAVPVDPGVGRAVADHPPHHRRRSARRATIDENETIELYAQLGQLEGDVLGRVDEAVDAWRRVIAIDPRDFRALAALETLFVREGRWEESIDVLEKRALVLEDEVQRRETLLQAASTWEEKVEDLTKAAQVYERVRASDPANARRERSPRSDLPPAVQVDRARRDLARALGARGPIDEQIGS